MALPAGILDRCGIFRLEPTGFPRYETVVHDPRNGCCTITSCNEVLRAVVALEEYYGRGGEQEWF